MKLFELIPESAEKGIANAEIRGITDNNELCGDGYIFVCIKGAHFDGHSAAEEMTLKGAALIVAEYDTGTENQLIVANTREYLSKLASRYYGQPTKRLKLVAVTGTNGKSTTIAIVKHILESFGHKTGSIGTIGYDVCGKVYEAHLTTPLPMDLYSYYKEMADNGAEYCVIEASSQALAQYRICGEEFAASAFMNLTQDHLDYHKTMENYFKAKKMLFDMSERAVVCIDDDYGVRLAKELKDIGKQNINTISINDIADYYAVNIKTTNSSVSYWLSSMKAEKSYPLRFAMSGRYNVANSLAAVALCAEMGFDLEKCVGYAQSFSGVNGRCEVIYDGEFTVMRDYAHTADALEKILTSVRSYAKGRIICLFGAAGERDADKRAPMGETVGKLADYAILTSDNPRFENAVKIIQEVEVGLKKTHIPYESYVDRHEAIKKALSTVRKSDIIILCGKGHETYQVIGDEYAHFDEREIVNEILENGK